MKKTFIIATAKQLLNAPSQVFAAKTELTNYLRMATAPNSNTSTAPCCETIPDGFTSRPNLSLS